MTYRAWELKPLDRAVLKELTGAIAEQAAEELEQQAMDEEPWSEAKYHQVLAAQQKEAAVQQDAFGFLDAVAAGAAAGDEEDR